MGIEFGVKSLSIQQSLAQKNTDSVSIRIEMLFQFSGLFPQRYEREREREENANNVPESFIFTKNSYSIVQYLFFCCCCFFLSVLSNMRTPISCITLNVKHDDPGKRVKWEKKKAVTVPLLECHFCSSVQTSKTNSSCSANVPNVTGIIVYILSVCGGRWEDRCSMYIWKRNVCLCFKSCVFHLVLSFIFDSCHINFRSSV